MEEIKPQILSPLFSKRGLTQKKPSTLNRTKDDNYEVTHKRTLNVSSLNMGHDHPGSQVNAGSQHVAPSSSEFARVYGDCGGGGFTYALKVFDMLLIA